MRENYHRFKKLTPEQRQRLRERWQNATPGRAAADAGAPPAAAWNAGSNSRRRANYCAVEGAGVGGIFFVLVPGLAQLIT